MPIPIEEFVNPSFIRLRDRYTIAGIESHQSRFGQVVWETGNDTRKYKHGDWLRAGYNPNHNSIRVERVRLVSNNYTLKPY
jgi:hypothetical protein